MSEYNPGETQTDRRRYRRGIIYGGYCTMRTMWVGESTKGFNLLFDTCGFRQSVTVSIFTQSFVSMKFIGWLFIGWILYKCRTYGRRKQTSGTTRVKPSPLLSHDRRRRATCAPVAI